MKHLSLFLLIQLIIWSIGEPIRAKDFDFTNPPVLLRLPVVALTFTYAQTNVQCNGQTDGSITVTASGGTSPYQYSKDNGVTFQASNAFTNLGAGTYPVIVKDNAGSISTVQNVVISQPQVISFGTRKTDVSGCYGATTGTISLSIGGGGTPPYQFSKDNGVSYQSFFFFNNLRADTYQIILKDDRGCLSAAQTVIIDQPAALSLSFSQTNVSGCTGDPSGAITVNASGGTAPYQYSKDNGASFQTSNGFTGLAAGSYTLLVKDANGCTSSPQTATITQPNRLSATLNPTDVSCYSASTGTITVNASGGTAPYQYKAFTGTYNHTQTESVFTDLGAGFYYVTITDAHNCATTQMVMIRQPTALSVSAGLSNVSCNGASTGSINVSASGGTAPYQYSKDNGATYQTSNGFSGLAAGRYEVVVKDANGCVSASQSVAISQPAVISFSTRKTDVSDCYGTATGMISVSIGGGGTPPYQFSKDNGVTFQSIGNFNNLAAGPYQIVLKDANDCISSAQSVTVQQPPALSLSISQTNVNGCSGDLTGSISVHASGGTAPYQYSKDNGVSFQGSNVFTGLAAGAYQVVVKDANGCVSWAQGATLTQPNRLSFGFSQSDASCYGTTTGSITLSASGGAAPYQYSKDNGASFQSSNVFTGLAAGAYQVVVKDANGCVTASQLATVAQPVQLTYTTTKTKTTCFGERTGSINVNANGGTSPYQYSGDNGASFQSSNVLNGLAAGPYRVMVKDANGCLSPVQSINIEQPAVISFSTRKTDVSDCYGTATGMISVSIGGGGTPPYQFSKDNGVTFQSIGNFNNLAAGPYQIVLRDANGCTSSAQSVAIQQPSVLTGLVSVTNVLCNGQAVGVLAITAAGGTAPYQYSKDNGTSYQPGNAFTGLTASNYNVIVKDANDCLTASQTATITQPTPLTYTATKTRVTCFGESSGSITVNVSGGTSPYQFSKDNGTSFQGSNVFSGLTVGSYPVVVKDANGCTSSAQSIDVDQPAVISFSTRKFDVSDCYGAATGTISVSIGGGGTPPYQFSKDNGASFQSIGNFNNLTAGTYQIVLKDANGCSSAVHSVTIQQPSALSFSLSQINVTLCAGDLTGSITVNASGGTASYQYSKDNGASFQTSNVFSGLAAGNYTLLIKDANGCTSTSQTATITQPNLLSATLSTTDVSCYSASTGSITVNASGGTPPYQYKAFTGTYNHTQTESVFTNLAAGFYYVTITDAHNCVRTESSTILQPTALTVSTSLNHVSCNGASTGSITVNASGGTAPYQYAKDNGASYQSNNTFSDLAAGHYRVLVKDANGCISSAQMVTITQPAVISFSTRKTDVSDCYGTATGMISVSIGGGGTPPYQFSKDNGVTFQSIGNFNNLAADTYQIVLKDANGCTSPAQSVAIQQPSVLTGSVSVTNVLCNGQAVGVLAITAAGGTAPYQYSKDNGTTYQATNNFSALTAGTYPVVIKDSRGCLLPQSATVTQPDVLTFTSNSTNISCAGGTNGSITLTATGGAAPYQYSKDNGVTYQAGNQFGGLAMGNYSVMVKDANGCTATVQLIPISQPPVLTMASSKTDVSTCYGASNGAITLTATGGTGPYQYSKDNGITYQTASQFAGLTAGSYSVLVKDAAGCSTVSQTVIINQPVALSFSTTKTDVTCYSTSTGSLTITATGGTAPYQYSKDKGANFQSTNQFTNLSANTYALMVKDANGCTTAAQLITITQPALIEAQVVSVTSACPGVGSGGVTLAATGGVGPYQYSLDNGAHFQTSSIFTGLAAGNLAVTIKDAAGCVAGPFSIEIQAPAAPIVTASVNSTIACYGGATGSIKIDLSGGSNLGVVYYSIDNGTTYIADRSPVDNLAAGPYQVVVSYGNGCRTPAQSLTITQPASPLSLSLIGKTDVSCQESGTGSFTLAISGGTAPVQYSKDNGATFQTNPVFAGLGAGGYPVVVKDANGCTTSAPMVTILEPSLLTAAPATTNINCKGQSNGTITITASGGTAPYQYSKDNGATFQSANRFSGLSAGIYALVIKDAKGCTATQSSTITQPDILTFTVAGTNATCGNPNGSITLTATGGTAPYQYSKDNGTTYQSGNQFIDLVTGTYSVIIKDANGCQTPAQTITITQPTALSLSVSKTDLANCAATPRSITATVSGGTAPFQYSKDNGVTYQASNEFGGLSGGIYAIVAKDAAGCTTPAQTVVLTQPGGLMIAVAKTNVTTCSGSNNGSITVTASGGTGGYQYSKDNGVTYQASSQFTNLPAGNYSVTVKDAGGCQSVPQTITITQPTPLSVSISQTNASCSESTSGSFTIAASGGTAPYQYSKDNGATFQTSNRFTGLSAGVYPVVVNDANNCLSTTQSVTLSQPAALSYTVSHTDLTCNGSANGTITLTASGGTGAYQYSMTNPASYQTTNVFTNLNAGIYQVSIKDGSNCLSPVQSITLVQPARLAAVISQTNVTSCSAGGNGAIAVSASGGTAPYRYSADNGTTYQADNQFVNLSAGTYQVLVNDANGCLSTVQLLTITQPNALSLLVSKTDVSMAGGTNGAISVTASGGTTPYQYSKDNGSTYQASSQFSGLIAGTYTVVVKDANGCTTPGQPITIAQPTTLTVTTAQTSITCFGAATGSISVTVAGGSSPYQYSKDNGASFQSSNVFTSLTAGAYQIVVKDASGYIAPAQTVTLAQPAQLASIASTTNVSCFGGANGAISVATSGGTEAYQYSSDNGITFQAGSQFNNVTAGTYSIVVKDKNGCVTPAQRTTISQPTPIRFTVSPINVGCYGSASGSIQVMAEGGSGSYQYAVTNTTDYQTSSHFQGLSAGTYEIRVKDGANCLAPIQSVVLVEPALLTAVVSQTNVTSCTTEGNGIISISASGGTAPPYQYSQDNGVSYQTSNRLVNLSVGQYALLVKDAAGCLSAVQVVTLTQPSPLSVLTAKTDVSNYGRADGLIHVTASGGMAPYQYSIDHGLSYQSTAQFTNLVAGNYAVVVKDANGCNSPVQLLTLTQPTLLTVVAAQTDIHCFGASNGSIRLTASGGVPPYQYSTNGGSTYQTDNLFTNLSAGVYSVVVKDASGYASPAQSLTLHQVSQLTVVASVTNVSCFGGANGLVSVGVTGGTAPYQYSRDNGRSFQTDAQFSGLSAGSYQVVVRDANGCTTAAESLTLSSKAGPTLSLSAVQPQCADDQTGRITSQVIGGTPPYSYSWNGSDKTTSALDNLRSGLYTLQVTDQNKCLVQDTIRIIEPLRLALPTFGPSTTVCLGDTARLDANNPTAQVQWFFNGHLLATTNQIATRTAGQYSVQITNSTGCSLSASVGLSFTRQRPTPVLLISSQAKVGEVVTVLDLTLPAPDSVRWILPAGASIAPVPAGQAVSPYIQYLTFTQPGAYTIRSQITALKVCQLTASNRIQILGTNQTTFYDSTFAQQGNYDPANFIETLTIGPNPNQGNFTADITLKDISTVTLRLQNGQGITVYEQEQSGAKTFSFPVSISPSGGAMYYFVNVRVRFGDQNQQLVQRTLRILITN